MKHLLLITAMVFYSLSANAAEAVLDITAKIISAEDTENICNGEYPPEWCAKYLSNIEPEAGEPQGEYVENPVWIWEKVHDNCEDEVYE